MPCAAKRFGSEAFSRPFCGQVPPPVHEGQEEDALLVGVQVGEEQDLPEQQRGGVCGTRGGAPHDTEMSATPHPGDEGVQTHPGQGEGDDETDATAYSHPGGVRHPEDGEMQANLED